MMERLSVALSVELPGPLRRSVARIYAPRVPQSVRTAPRVPRSVRTAPRVPQSVRNAPRVPQSVRNALRVPRSSLALGSHLFRPILAALGVTMIALIAVSLNTSSATQASRLQPAVAVSNVLGAPAAIHRSRVQARKEAAAEARRAAERRREREAAAAAAAAARKAAAKATSKSVPAVSPPVMAPATPSPGAEWRRQRQRGGGSAPGPGSAAWHRGPGRLIDEPATRVVCSSPTYPGACRGQPGGCRSRGTTPVGGSRLRSGLTVCFVLSQDIPRATWQ